MPSGLLSTDGADFASSTAGNSTASYLVPRTLMMTLFKAQRKKLFLRGLAAKIFRKKSIPGRTLVLPFESERTANNTIQVNRVGEGAEILESISKFENITFTPVKYGARVPVTEEMLEDGIIDLVDYHAELAGYEFADNEESLIVSQLDAASTAAGHDVSNSNATLPITDITAAMQFLEADNYVPTDMIIGVEIANDLRNIDTFTEADKAGMNDPSRRLIGTIFQMRVLVSNNVSSVLAYVIDRAHAFAIAEKRALKLERYKDFAKDTRYLVATQRLAVRYWRANAVSEITTT